jgi:hypothetical protein
MGRCVILTCAATLSTAAAPAPAFDPLAFFTGASRGSGHLKVMLKASVPIRVKSVGSPDGKGGIILDQTINEGNKPPRERRWTLRQTSATTMTGTVTDTPGLVQGRVSGNRLLLSYTMKGGMKASQVLTLQPGGRSVINRMTVKRLGLTVARVEEVITKGD